VGTPPPARSPVCEVGELAWELGSN